MKRKRAILIAVLTLALGLGGWAAYARNRAKAVPVLAAKVETQDIVSKVTANGKIQAVNRVEMSALVMGQIINLAVREGDRVRKGDFLLQIDRNRAAAEEAGSDAALRASLSDRDSATQLVALQEREETLRSFLANTTHDLMLPLTVLQGHLSRLKRHAEEGSHDPAVVTAAAEETEYIASLLNNLAAAAKLEAGELLPGHPFDLSALVERVVERHRPIACSRGIEIGHAVPRAALWVEGDVTLVEQAVGNLVHNGVRHNRSGGHVAVVLDEANAHGFLLRVSDDGPGVPPDQRERLGERRFRTDEARQRNPEGKGLGLSIAREVATRHGFVLAFRANEPSGLVAELRGTRSAS